MGAENSRNREQHEQKQEMQTVYVNRHTKSIDYEKKTELWARLWKNLETFPQVNPSSIYLIIPYYK